MGRPHSIPDSSSLKTDYQSRISNFILPGRSAIRAAQDAMTAEPSAAGASVDWAMAKIFKAALVAILF